MPLSPGTRDRLVAGIAHVIRTGRHVSTRAAESVYGGLPSFGWALLLPLEREGEQRCSALAAQAGVDVSVVSRQVSALERQGYLERRPDPHDGRASLIRLSEAGAAVLARTRAVRSEWTAAALADWDEEDARRLGDLLERLAADLDRAAPPARQPLGAAS
ncbi:MarR family winged helix-turn-helix transcriptional regulator [Geodermatophilus sp. URMC 62]|uniref:MarR family winged helix-turn-helix transcriptional regulator n=1 Tax=Geodermatophilus sp. URMC 62 TaxID=3423414 RepID=UPI00406D42D5